MPLADLFLEMRHITHGINLAYFPQSGKGITLGWWKDARGRGRSFVPQGFLAGGRGSTAPFVFNAIGDR